MNDEKPFDPTPARLARARREGDVPRSGDLGAVSAFGGAALATALVGPQLRDATATALVHAAAGETSVGPYASVAIGIVTVLAAAGLGAILVSLAQTGGLVVRPITVRFEKLAPLPGLKRLISRDAAYAAGKAFVLAAVVSAILVPATRDAFAGGATPLSAAAIGERLGAVATRIASGGIAIASLFAVGDVILERTKWKRRLRMSFDEIKRDHKQNEGDPLLRGRRRQAHRALVRGSVARVRDAAFVVTNPTHIAIALEYRPPMVAVPRVLVRAIDAGAADVRKRARDLGVPLIENVALARELLATTDVGDPIPVATYVAVAAIVATLPSRSRVDA